MVMVITVGCKKGKLDVQLLNLPSKEYTLSPPRNLRSVSIMLLLLLSLWLVVVVFMSRPVPTGAAPVASEISHPPFNGQN